MSNQTHFFFPIHNALRTQVRLNRLEAACNGVISNPSGEIPKWMESLNPEYLSRSFDDVKVVITNKGPAISVAIPFIVEVSCLGAILHSLFELEPSDTPEWLIPITMQSGTVRLLVSRQRLIIFTEDADLSHATTGIPLTDVTESRLYEEAPSNFPFSKLPPIVGIHGLPNTYKSALALYLARTYAKKAKLVYICNEVYPSFSGINAPEEVLYDSRMSYKSLVRYLSMSSDEYGPIAVIIDCLNELYSPRESASTNAARVEKLLRFLKTMTTEKQAVFILIAHDKSDTETSTVSKHINWDILTTAATKQDVTFTLKTSTGTEFHPITLPMTPFE